MANNCYIDFIIETETEQDADKLDSVLAKNYFSAKKEQRGMYIGSPHRYLFEPTLERQDETTLRLMGWVKWSINYEEATDIVSFLLSSSNISYIGIRYEEMGFNLYGEYVYSDENKLLLDNFVDKDDFPDYKDGDNDLFYEELENVFQKKSTEELVHDFYKYPVQNNPDENKEELPF